MGASRTERLEAFFRRLRSAPAVSTFDEARTDGRMYPPQDDARRVVPNHLDVVRFRSRAHNTFIRSNGAFEIRTTGGDILVSRAGADGRGVWA